MLASTAAPSVSYAFPWCWHSCNHADLFPAFSPHQISSHSSFQTVPGNSCCCRMCLEDGWLLRAGWRVSCSLCGSPLTLHVFAEHGFVGYSKELMFNNTLPDYSQGESFFTVFGVFFPAATGTVSFILLSFPHSHISEMAKARGVPLDGLVG